MRLAVGMAAAVALTSAACVGTGGAPPVAAGPPLHEATCATCRPRITTAHDSSAERATRDQLGRLFDRYDLTPWRFTDAVLIDQDALPHSHPVLTLHTRHEHDDLLLLSTYIHEQSHWYFQQHLEATKRMMTDLEATFPDLPVGYPDGATDRESSYLHLGVIFFEQRGLVSLVGELAAHQVMEFWSTDHYRALYRKVLDDSDPLRAALKKNELQWPRPGR